MIQTKYLIIIITVIVLLIIYFFYDAISNNRKKHVSLYQKVSALEAKIFEMEKSKINNSVKNKNIKNDSPALSITYQSDMLKNNNQSVKYADLTDSEAKMLIKNIQNNKINSKKNGNLIPNESKSINGIRTGEFSDFAIKNQNNIDENTDTINIKIDKLIKNAITPMNTEKKQKSEYQQILKGLSNIDGFGNTELDQDIISSITKSIHYADIPSNHDLSETPNNSVSVKEEIAKNNKKSKSINKTKKT